VDPLSRQQFWKLIAEMRLRHRGMSILVATAYMEEAERLDWLVMMEGGRVLAAGTPGELKAVTGRKTIEDAYIALLPEGRRAGHHVFTIHPRTISADGVAIEAQHLTKRFGAFTAVDDVSFMIPKGEIFGFVGSNGCGKTTTMKMVTGLLPPTTGEAYLFGSTVDAGSIAMRRRIGYMSQTFSLYGELTVRQNLTLHAHLFDLPAADIPARVEKMTASFDLDEVMDDQAERLPLGIRQRLSLAVATIHDPEVLILDEPTSGVDPIARDHFWELLVGLSRQRQVTIFITTHYMNEAGRCDRVALMSNGRVLACDAPEELTRRRECRTLEEAFIAYMRDDADADDREEEAGENAGPEPLATTLPAPEHSGRRQRFDIRRLAALASKETIELLRDPVLLIFSLLVAPFLLLVYGYGITTDIEIIRFAVLDHDGTTASRIYAEHYTGSPYFRDQGRIFSPAEMERGFQKMSYSLVIEIPPGFARDLKRERSPAVGVWIDGTMPFRAETAKNFAEAVHLAYLADQSSETSVAITPVAARIESRYWYNPNVRSRFAIVPGLLAVVLMLVPTLLTAVAVVREKELGSITNLYTSPVTRLEFLWGKQLPYIVVNAINFLMLTAIILFLFRIPFRGSFPALIVGAFLYIVASTGIGLLISTFTRTQIAALVAAFVLTMIPSFQFSGLLTPVSSLTGGAAFMARYFPARYFLSISVGTFTKAIGFSELATNYLVLIAMCMSLTAMTVWLLKKQEK
jgi:ribosome-dependent ATPase